jgi:two-component system, chemotaxis family, chemotaxis protein CheY
MGKPVVLIVDDDPKILDMLTQVLTLEGYPIERAINGHEAIKHLEEASDRRILLLDLVMPLMDGWGVVRWMIEHPNVKARTKIILMSANERLKQASDIEHDAELPKPFDLDKLLAILQSFQ